MFVVVVVVELNRTGLQGTSMGPKERLKKEHGSLRELSVKTKINYYRLSQILNGWVEPKPEEAAAIGLSQEEIDELAKRRA